jgi:nucleotide-binding universal stress UspA family protein
MKTILVPVDLSYATARLCDAACLLARQLPARLLLLHVVQTPPFLMNDYYWIDTGFMNEVVAAGEKIAKRRLETLARRCAKGNVEIATVLARGKPISRIIEQAGMGKAAYIVIGSHGHGAVFDLLMGSTTQGVLRRAHCPVLVVPVSSK